MCRSRAAASSEDACAAFGEFFHGFRKFLRLHIILRHPVQKFWHSGIRLDKNGHVCRLIHCFYLLCHPVGTYGAIHPHRIGAETLQHNHCRFRIRPIERPPRLFKRQADQNGTVAAFFHGKQCRAAFLQAHHRFDHIQIHAGGFQRLHLFFINFYQFLKLQFSDRIQLAPCHGKIGGNICPAQSRLPG